MAKKKSDLSISEVVDVANRTYEYMFDQLSRNGYINTGHMASVVAILFRISFAFDERGNGIDAARRTFDSAFNFMSNTMIEGAWDEVNQKMKSDV
jgi:hypothetical protein